MEELLKIIWRPKIFSIGVVCLLALTGRGCNDPESDDKGADENPSEADEGISQIDVDISPVAVDGVWVFNYTPDGSWTALMTGVAEIANGCLVVDRAVVIWHSDTMDEVRDLVANVLSGEKPTVKMGGGGFSLEEGGSDFTVPSVIEERCSPVTSLWYGGQDPITMVGQRR